MSSGPRPPRRPADFLAAAMGRQLRLGPKRNKITVDRGLEVPMSDGTILLADHYAPVTAEPRPTVLMRTPYGRGWEMAMMGRPFAERGYHLLLQSCRGTFGSGGTFTPGLDEAADGQDTVAWLRKQDWFNGRLATAGPSYLAFTAWALALDPPPELTAMALYVSPHDLAAAGFGRGPFELFNLLLWTDLMAHQERHGSARMMWRTMTADKRLAAAMDRLPLAATGSAIGGDAVPWYGDWLAHPERGPVLGRLQRHRRARPGHGADPAGQRLPRLLRRADDAAIPGAAPARRHRGADRRPVDPHERRHGRGDSRDARVAGQLRCRERGRSIAPAVPVRVWVSGREQWKELSDWPPADTVATTLPPACRRQAHRRATRR